MASAFSFAIIAATVYAQLKSFAHKSSAISLWRTYRVASVLASSIGNWSSSLTWVPSRLWDSRLASLLFLIYDARARAIDTKGLTDSWWPGLVLCGYLGLLTSTANCRTCFLVARSQKYWFWFLASTLRKSLTSKRCPENAFSSGLYHHHHRRHYCSFQGCSFS